MAISNCLPACPDSIALTDTRQTGSRLLLKIREDLQFGVYSEY